MLAIIRFDEDMDTIDLLKELTPVLCAAGLEVKRIEIVKYDDQTTYGK
jgi:hypothetical protein